MRRAAAKGFLWTIVLASLAAPAACILPQSSGGFAAGGGATAGGGHDSDSPDGGDDDGGGESDDDAGDDLDAGAEPEGVKAMHCSLLPFGCICSPAEPSQARACTAASVVRAAGQQGVCCENTFNCICVAYECVRAGGGCSCQLVAASAGTRVDDCSAVTASPGITCCRSYGQCVCSAAECLLTETQVPTCAVADLLVCAMGETSVSKCEPAGISDGGTEAREESQNAFEND